MERMSQADAEILRQESESVGGHLAVLLIFDRPDGSKGELTQRVRERVDRRMHLMPRCRERMHPTPLDLGPPAWEDDPTFDVDRHVDRVPARGDVDDEELRRRVGEMMSVPLERDRPLWRMDVFERLSEGRAGIVAKVHHAMTDGAGTVLLIMTLLVDADEGALPASGDWTPAPGPDDWDLLGQAFADRGRAYAELARSVALSARTPSQWRRVVAGLGRARGVAERELAPHRAHEPFNDRITSGREVAWISYPWDSIVAIRDAVGKQVTVNDLFLAATAGGVRRWLEGLGAELGYLRVKIPVGMHAPGETQMGNADSLMYVDLPVAEGDPLRRLEAVARQTTERKATGDADAIYGAFDLLGKLSPRLYDVASRVQMSSHLFAFEISNNRGPNAELDILGGRVHHVYPFTNIARRHSLRVTFTSGLGEVTVTLCVDPTVFPDVVGLARGTEEALEELHEAAAARAGT